MAVNEKGVVAQIRSFEQQLLERTPRFVHSKSNTTYAQVVGTMRGAIMRCLDVAGNEDVYKLTKRDTFGELLMLGYKQKTFAQALRGLAQALRALAQRYSFWKLNCRLDRLCISGSIFYIVSIQRRVANIAFLLDFVTPLNFSAKASSV